MLEGARVAHLGLIDDRDRPRVLPVTFALAGGELVSAVDDKPKRVPADEVARLRYLRRRPEASLTVDEYDDDWSRLAWVQLNGRVEISEAGRHPEAVDALRSKYPQYAERPPAGPLLRLSPESVLCWRAREETA